MKNFLSALTIILFALPVCTINAQTSIHLLDKLKHANDSLNVNTAKSSYYNTITTGSSNSGLTKKVFGYLPDWEYLADDNHTTLDFNLLTHIAIFEFTVNENGVLTDPAEWLGDRWTSLITEAHEDSVKIILAISNISTDEDYVDSNVVHTLITSESAKAVFFTEVKDRLTESDADGINLDFENIKYSDRNTPIVSFTQELHDSLNSWFPDTDMELSYATPPVDWSGDWDFDGIADACDYIFIMGYDYYGSWSTSTGPVAPLTGFYRDYEAIFEEDYANVAPSKIILGVPYYGAKWYVDTAEPYQTVSTDNWLENVDYMDVDESLLSSYLVFDDSSQTTYYIADSLNSYILCWIDSDTSLALKYDLAIKEDVLGVGMWSLGKDGKRTELWDVINKKFGTGVSAVTEDETVTNDFALYQNYPNPFNPSTVIKYRIPEAGNVIVKVYNILGSEVATLVNKKQAAGSYKVSFNASGLASGIYFYRIQAGQNTETKKMLLLK